MLETMYVRCAQCGYDNSPDYRFCGMCGGSLAQTAIEAKPPVRDVTSPLSQSPLSHPDSPPRAALDSGPLPFREELARPGTREEDRVHGPSFLGLSEDPKVEFNYLYEDEPARSHAGLIAVLILLLAVGGFAGWQWRHNGFPFNRLNVGAGTTTPAAPQSQQSNPTEPNGSQSNPAPDASTGNTPSASSNDARNSASPAGTSQPSAAPASGEEGKSAAATEAPSSESAAPATAEKAETPAPAKVRRGTEKTAPSRNSGKAVAAASEKTAVLASPDADLEAAGERYLYGNGVTQNCGRAESSLTTAAAKGNSKAQTVLGTMYATGHCVGRDLPAAYRWFARALHADPQNSRISADLQVLWRQMTTEERQLATAKQ